MKPFNLEEAKAGKPVCTKVGFKARIICYDGKSAYPIVALIDVRGIERVLEYNTKGKLFVTCDSKYDLMMAGEKKEGWINLYRCHNSIITSKVYETMKEATASSNIKVDNFISTIKIEWEE